MASSRRNALRLLLFILACLGAFWFLRVFDTRNVLRLVLERIDALGAWAPFWFVISYVVACLTFFPGVILTLGGGILFGVIQGTFLVTIGATLGAACAFLLSRHFARGFVVKKLSSNPTFLAIDRAVEREGWKIVGLVRLSPAFPFVPLNFAFGLTRIPFWQFFIVTWFSVIPSSCMFVYLGSLMGDIAALGNQPIAQGKTKWIVSAAGLISAIIVTVLVTRIAKRALSARLQEI